MSNMLRELDAMQIALISGDVPAAIRPSPLTNQELFEELKRYLRKGKDVPQLKVHETDTGTVAENLLRLLEQAEDIAGPKEVASAYRQGDPEAYRKDKHRYAGNGNGGSFRPL